MSDLSNVLLALPEQFTDPTAGMSLQQLMWWDGLKSGTPVSLAAYEQVPSYRAVVDLFGGSTGPTFANALYKLNKEHAERVRDLLKKHGKKPQRLTQADVTAVFAYGLGKIEEGSAPSTKAALSGLGKDDAWVNSVRCRKSPKQNLRALEQHADHPVLQTISGSPLEVGPLHEGTMAHSLKAVRKHFLNAQMLELIQSQVQAEVAKALRQHDTRLNIIESGEHWHDIARRMRAEGKGPKAIATTTGQPVNTVKSWVRRNLTA
ncbi:hypothetical protein BV326_02913 [Pseudomonas syringae pv. actinidiae]|uniref:hypothetical protein n=1 Tax=Pseudomonas syringae TaxID=317 RepID=UPI000A25D7D9|nr:hypothetical protein [Pseudomonas syringae]OSR70521.1 hypothetical protein BV326_02913 [Pseudomonas syringae pv. actinidiae]